MLFLLALSTILSAGAMDSDDGTDGYMSLLQESVSVFKQAASPPSASSGFNGSEFLFGAAGVAVLGAVVYFTLVKGSASKDDDNEAPMAKRPSVLEGFIHRPLDKCSDDEVDVREPDTLEEDTYCLAIALIVRDLHALESGKAQNRALRYARLAFAVGLIMLTIFLQLAVLAGTKKYVTPQQVAGIRDAYDQYEVAMYPGHSYLNQNGKHRGVPGYFDAKAFDKLDGDLQQDVCNIPLSQVNFLSLVLLIWSITCMAQLKQCVENFMCVIFFAKTIASMKDAITEEEEEDDEGLDDEVDDASDIDDGIPMSIITGVTMKVKVLLTVFVFLPDFATTCFILWLGSRWLVATNDFGNVLSNAVALEFILMLKELLYYALASERNKRDLTHTGLAPAWSKEPAGYTIYFGSSLAWAFFAIAWVWYYVHHQGVLPDYKWDVNGVCTTWLQNS
jgi:hypothetical protein